MKNNVLRLYVPVNNIMLMQVLYCIAYLTNNTSYFLLRKSTLFSQHWINVPWVAQFNHKVNEFSLLEVCVKLTNVRMVQKWLNLYFTNQLLDNALIFKKFRHFLYRAHEIRLYVSWKVDCSELSLSQRFDKLEVF